MTQVVALFILVLEKSGTTATSQSCLQSPFAGFIIGTLFQSFNPVDSVHAYDE